MNLDFYFIMNNNNCQKIFKIKTIKINNINFNISIIIICKRINKSKLFKKLNNHLKKKSIFSKVDGD